jgi:hypothetical protein
MAYVEFVVLAATALFLAGIIVGKCALGWWEVLRG